MTKGFFWIQCLMLMFVTSVYANKKNGIKSLIRECKRRSINNISSTVIYRIKTGEPYPIAYVKDLSEKDIEDIASDDYTSVQACPFFITEEGIAICAIFLKKQQHNIM